MTQPKVVITGPADSLAIAKIKQHCAVKMWDSPQPIPRETLEQWLEDADGIYNSGSSYIDASLLEHAPQLKVVSQLTAGYDNVDVDACTARSIPVSNAASALTETTADLTFALLLAAARKLPQCWDLVRQGGDYLTAPWGIDLFGKVLGIVGMGAIGSAVARRAQACGMEIIYHNRSARPDAIGRWVDFDELLAQSDCIIVLCPLTSQTRGLFNANAFKKMKPTAHFINAARGAVVVTADLYHALKHNLIAYAALDVTDPEPLPANHPLLALPNVLVTPHIGSATPETRQRRSLHAVDNLVAGLNQQPLLSCVNPQVNYR